MKHTHWLAIAILCILPPLAAPARARELKLIPEPKQAKPGEGQFTVTAKTRVLINSAHADEDRAAAEMLAEEIERATGLKIRIATTRSISGGSGTIYLVHAGDDTKASARLDSIGLGMDHAFDKQGYVVDVDPNQIIVSAPTGQGLFYGIQTLRQLLVWPGSGAGGTRSESGFPAVQVKDWPSMQWRGVHDDISRGPVPTLDYMKNQIRTCAAYKLNLFSLYIEHVFDYRNNPLIGPKEGSLSADEIRELVAYANRYYVTILPEQQAFGHLHNVLKYEVYSELGETPHGHVLAPVNDKSYELIESLYAELVPLFPGPLFHIGADETFELGRGQTKSRADEVGLGRVYLEHLKRVAEIMKPYDKRLMFWGDIAIRYPDLLSILPKDVIAVAWRYNPAPSFENLLKPYKDAHLDVFVAPGANNWNRIFPNLDAAYINIKNFVRDGQKYEALGMLNTTWDDDGESLFGMTWPAVVFGAACSWQAGESSVEKFESSYDWAFYRSEGGALGDAAQSLSRANSLLAGVGLAGAYDDQFWLDPFTDSGTRYTQKALPVAHDLRLAAEHALELLYKNRQTARQNGDTLDYMILAAIRLDALGMKIQFAAEISKYYWDAYLNMSDASRVRRDLAEISNTNGRLEDLRGATTRLRALYSELWLKENRPYWLGNVLVRYDTLAGLFQSKINAIQAAIGQYRDQSTLPTPQQMGFLIH
jgi:hypothetical protein